MASNGMIRAVLGLLQISSQSQAQGGALGNKRKTTWILNQGKRALKYERERSLCWKSNLLQRNKNDGMKKDQERKEGGREGGKGRKEGKTKMVNQSVSH